MHLQPLLQSAAERAVGGRSVCVVAVEARTGRILALVNEEMACRKTYPPGSALKLITAFAGLEESVITPETAVVCRNHYRSGRESLICSIPGGHGKTSLEEAISQSCNIYFYNLVEELGPERLLRHFRGFGLGSRFGGYPAGQVSGSVPAVLSGSPAIARAAIGQARDLQVTPVQMAAVTMAIANDGIQYEFHVDGRSKPSVVRTVRARPGTWRVLRSGMRRAVVSGTAKEARATGMNVCGKTGSPQTDANPDHRHGWFVGFAPYEKPEIVVVVFSEWGHGGTAAAPIARKVFEAYRDSSGRLGKG